MLQVFTFGRLDESPHLLLTGGVHGDEFESIAALQILVRQLTGPAPPLRIQRGSVTIIPVVNVPAFLRGHRCGDDLRDLARSFPGDPHGTETQRIAFEVSPWIRAADAYVDLHTGGTELRVLPLSGYMLHPNRETLEQQRRMAQAFNLPLIWGTTPDLDGRSLSVARDANVPAIYCEHGGSATCRQEGVLDYVAGCRNVLSLLGIVDEPVPPSRVQHSVEDSNNGSGHMQICHPSPLEGLFVPAVGLGDQVQAGQSLGTIHPIDGSPPQAVTADRTGILIVQRTFPRVRPGDSVGVIL